MDYSVKTRKLKPTPVVAIRLQTTPQGIGPAFRDTIPEVLGYIQGAGASPAGPSFGRYYDYDEDRVDLEIGFPLDAALPGDGRVQAGELPGGRVAVTLHKGDYTGLAGAHDAIADWVLASERDTAGAVWEVYLVGQDTAPDPADWRTEIVWPLR